MKSKPLGFPPALWLCEWCTMKILVGEPMRDINLVSPVTAERSPKYQFTLPPATQERSHSPVSLLHISPYLWISSAFLSAANLKSVDFILICFCSIPNELKHDPLHILIRYFWESYLWISFARFTIILPASLGSFTYLFLHRNCCVYLCQDCLWPLHFTFDCLPWDLDQEVSEFLEDLLQHYFLYSTFIFPLSRFRSSSHTEGGRYSTSRHRFLPSLYSEPVFLISLLNDPHFPLFVTHQDSMEVSSEMILVLWKVLKLSRGVFYLFF